MNFITKDGRSVDLEVHVNISRTESESIFPVYVTKYALTTGIYVAPVVLNDTYWWTGWNSYHPGKDASETLEEAKAIAERMRNKRILTLEKQIAKLRVLKIKTPE